MKRFLSFAALIAIFLSGCAGNTGVGEGGYRSFPAVSAPAVYQDTGSAADYLAVHYWDDFFSGKGVNDTSAVLGVRTAELEKAMANYVAALDKSSLATVRKGMNRLFDKVSDTQKEAPESHAYTVFSQLVEKYLYDPDSPFRNEDFFLPYVSALAKSPLTAPELIPSYEYQARMCSMNQFGQKVPDFKFKLANGSKKSLYGVKADYTVLFFSNPGCTACREIIDALVSIPGVNVLIGEGKLAVVCIYIDREIEKWLDYEPNYPRNWICGYDYKYIIRDDTMYNVRAIPSLYLLDGKKRVIMKDAPTDKVIDKIHKELCQQ